MSNVFIKSVIAKGQNKRDSIVEFSQNLSIIYGASNTGKTYIYLRLSIIFLVQANLTSNQILVTQFFL